MTSAEDVLRDLVARFAPEQAPLVDTIRRRLRERLPGAHEIVYEYRDAFVISWSPSGHGYEGVLALRAGAKGVVLYFNPGEGLPDPAKLLRGKGLTRSTPIADGAAFDTPALQALIDAVIARSPVAFDAGGRGSTAVRTTAAGKRRS
jgi:hypothetical protein